MFDRPVEPDDTPELSQLIMTLRNELNDSLRREHWSDAAAFQGCVMRLLDVLICGESTSASTS